MGSTGQKGVVVELEGIPNVRSSSAGIAVLELCNSSGEDGGRIPSQEHAQGGVLGGRINRRRRIAVGHVGPVETKPRAIHHRRAENVAPFQGGNLALGLRQDLHVIKAVGVSVGRVVKQVRPEQALFITDLVIYSGSKEIFVDNSSHGQDEARYVALTCTTRHGGK